MKADLINDFPALQQEVNGKRLVYLDNAASSQKPLAVINAIDHYYQHDHSNVHRGVHSLSQRATNQFDQARVKVQRYLNARSEREIIFTKGCTEAINLVAHSWGRQNLKKGDQILLSTMEHHANIVPWQMVCQEVGCEIIVAPISDSGELLLEEFAGLLSERVKIVSIVHVSNALGTVNPIKEITRLAKSVGAKVMFDGAQACGHLAVDLQETEADFYTVSGHKLYGPTGFGCLYGRLELLEEMPPYQTGGSMIRTVAFEGSTFADAPEKFEPGTPHISGAIGLGAAVDYMHEILGKSATEKLSSSDFETLQAHERSLMDAALVGLKSVRGVRIVGEPAHRAGTISFVMDHVHPHDIGTILDSEGVAIRAGHHCCMPLMKRLGVPATARASFAIYNTLDDVEALVNAVQKAADMFN